MKWKCLEAFLLKVIGKETKETKKKIKKNKNKCVSVLGIRRTVRYDCWLSQYYWRYYCDKSKVHEHVIFTSSFSRVQNVNTSPSTRKQRVPSWKSRCAYIKWVPVNLCVYKRAGKHKFPLLVLNLASITKLLTVSRANIQLFLSWQFIIKMCITVQYCAWVNTYALPARMEVGSDTQTLIHDTEGCNWSDRSEIMPSSCPESTVIHW